MKRKRPQVYWALWNYDTLQCVEYSRRRCREYAVTLMGDRTGEMFKTGSFRTSKVTVREVRRPK